MEGGGEDRIEIWEFQKRRDEFKEKVHIFKEFFKII